MGRNSKWIKLTLRIENSQYHDFHERTRDLFIDHTHAIRLLIELFLINPDIISDKRLLAALKKRIIDAA